MSALSVADAACALGLKPGTLRRFIREGCPVARRGQRGRGHSLLVDPAQVLQWRGADERAAAILELASALPGVLAGAAAEAFQQIEGTDKRRMAGTLAATWFVLTSAALDHLRSRVPSVPEVTAPLPEPIERLKQIARA